MKKIFTILAAISLFSASALAQTMRTPEFELIDAGGVESNLRLAFPMYFGFTSPMEYGSRKFPDTIFSQNFYYALEMASVRFSSPSSPFSLSIGLKWTFMDFSLKDTGFTFRPDSDGTYGLVPIINEEATYDGKKSKVHASYFGAPVRIAFRAGRAKLHVGASAEYMFNGYTKYRAPKYRLNADDLFNRFRASAEAGLSYGLLGVFVNYSITPVFAESVSDCNALTFGLTLGI